MKRKLLFIFLLSLCSCQKGKEIKYPTILLSEIFLQKEREYHIMFYLDSCIACRNLKLTLSKYNEKVYYIDLLKCQFNDTENDNVGLTSYQDINVKTAPTMFKISNKIILLQKEGYNDCREYILTCFQR